VTTDQHEFVHYLPIYPLFSRNVLLINFNPNIVGTLRTSEIKRSQHIAPSWALLNIINEYQRFLRRLSVHKFHSSWLNLRTQVVCSIELREKCLFNLEGNIPDSYL
jgi:hypothetical protein